MNSRTYPFGKAPPVKQGSKVFVIEDGFIQGYFVVHEVRDYSYPVIGTDDVFDEGTVVVFDIFSWQPIEPIAMAGFGNFKYVPDGFVFQMKDVGCFDLYTIGLKND